MALHFSLAGIVAGLTFAVVGLSGLGWVIAVAVISGSATWLHSERVKWRQRAALAEQIADAAGALAALLNSGIIPSQAIREAAQDYPVLATAAAAAEVGADVPGTLRRQAQHPGAAGCAKIAAAWQVCERSGAPIADVLLRVAQSLREQKQLSQSVQTELSAARTSGHIMALLPLGSVALGFFAGVNSVEFLIFDSLGQWLVAGAVLLVFVGVWWIERLAK